MAGFRYVTLSRSVGRGGSNDRLDVMRVQELINAHLPPPLRPLTVDGVAGPLTENAIAELERRLIASSSPDARLDPHGPTLRALNHLRRRTALRREPPPFSSATPPRSMAQRTAGAGSLGASHGTSDGSRPSGGGEPGKTPAGGSTAGAANHKAPVREAHSKKGSGAFPPEVIAAAQAAQAKWGAPASITMAQWALESGWGKHMPNGSNNPFGIKAGRGQKFVMAPTREEVHGRTIHITAPFRVFDSLTEAFDQHGDLLHHHPAYAAARTHENDPDAYADALTHTYATESTYGSDLKSMMKHYDLYQYNKLIAGAEPH